MNELKKGTTGFRHTRVLGILFLSFVLSWMASVFYLFVCDQPLEYLIRETHEQDQWSRHFTADQGPRLIVTGGSSCTFSIDGGMATEQFHVPVINGGLEAGMGAYGVILEASRLVQPGDTLVIALEPPLLASPIVYSKDALQLFVRRMDWKRVAQAKDVTGRGVPLDLLFFSPRPGLDNFSAFLGRVATGTPFRYTTARIKPGGLMVTDFRIPAPLVGSAVAPDISPVNRDLLVHFHQWASQRNVRLVYSIPWLSVSKELAVDQKRLNARFLTTMLEFMPVVREEELGVQTDPQLYSDSGWHLTEDAAKVRTAELVSHIQAGDFWTADELAQAVARLQ